MSRSNQELGRSLPAPEPSDDSDLMELIVAQDQEALLLLYQRYGSPVYSLALRILRDPGQAEEVTQDTFLKVWQRSSQWDPNKGQLSSWLLTIARYTAIDRLRKERRITTQAVTSLEETVDPPATQGLVGDRLWQDGQLLRELMTQLPSEQAQVIELAFFLGLTHSELAEHLGWPLGTVKTRLRLGLHRLRTLWVDATKR